MGGERMMLEVANVGSGGSWEGCNVVKGTKNV